MNRDHYTTLGISAEADFATLRKAYRRRAMECHPDRFGGDPKKAEQFKRLVTAFNVLSDPLSRRDYDLTLGIAMVSTTSPAFDKGVYPEDEGAILDTLADDILEELIVGNVLPKDTSLQTLMLDLERTERFCLFREAKTRLYAGSTAEAEALFRRYVNAAPLNILARYFLSHCLSAHGRIKDAERQLRMAIRIGESRQPPLRLARIREELSNLHTQRPGLLGALRRLFAAPNTRDDNLSPEEKERRSLNRAINRLAATKLRARSARRRLRGA